jgi:pimeloyl-ACP methyl ester carboxylesterase
MSEAPYRDVPSTSIDTVKADGVRVFYRAAGSTTAPVVLLLHGFPASSFMFRELIPRLANDYRVIAPDLPGFGFTEVPAPSGVRMILFSFLRAQKRFKRTCLTLPSSSSIRDTLRQRHTL